jgi:hypothetical protein
VLQERLSRGHFYENQAQEFFKYVIDFSDYTISGL